jgi:hypothetical protein
MTSVIPPLNLAAISLVRFVPGWVAATGISAVTSTHSRPAS